MFRKVSKSFKLKEFYFARSATNSTIHRIRNVGLLAHVDAGKTTTTECMLFLTGKIKYFGDVNSGTTVTDFHELEKQRGITINSATVSFVWNDCKINLIDTPGHFDFSMEVEAAMTSINGAVVILDGIAGVEAQTSRLWTEADKHNIPRIVYINKLDRITSDFQATFQSIQMALGKKLLPIMWPVIDEQGLHSVMNVITCEETNTTTGRVTVKDLKKTDDKHSRLCHDVRIRLLDAISSEDDLAADKVLEYEKIDVFSEEEIHGAIKRITSAQKAVPVFIGSSIKSIGVKDLLDGITNYLPSPNEVYIHQALSKLQDSVLARVFKVFRDKHRGIVTLVYILRGRLKKGTSVYSIQSGCHEVIKSIAEPFANSFLEKDEASTGEIVGIFGMKNTHVGDILCDSHKKYKKVIENLSDELTKTQEEVKDLLCGNFRLPTSVVHSYVEPSDQIQQSVLQQALNDLQREDPSLSITEHGTEIVIGGQGNLHLEIFKGKLKTLYNIDVNMGKPLISYCEILQSDVSEIKHYQESSVSTDRASIEISIVVKNETTNEVHFHSSILDNTNINKYLRAVKVGILSSLTRGPYLNLPITNTHVMVSHLDVSRCRSLSFLSSAASNCVKKAIKETSTGVLEPYMDVNIIIDSKGFSKIASVKQDLLSRSAMNILEYDKKTQKEIKAIVPVRNLDGYFSNLQSLSSGRASLCMKYHNHYKMNSTDTLNLYKEMTGSSHK